MQASLKKHPNIAEAPPLPEPFAAWFARRGWQERAHQQAMRAQFLQRRDSLLIAPTGAGKTLAGFLPSLMDVTERSKAGQPYQKIHTLYLSPLKALATDIERNLLKPVEEMGLSVRIESRTGDTPQSKRKRQQAKPPHFLLTTPESLALLLSYGEAREYFSELQCIIVDEVHAILPTKRGDLLALLLSRLKHFAPQAVTFGLSATVADEEAHAAWLGQEGKSADIVRAEAGAAPEITILETEEPLPVAGFLPFYAGKEIYELIRQSQTTLVFVNTRAQAELVFQWLWDKNEDGLPIAIHHGSLTKEERRKVEAAMAAEKLRAVVATSSLDLGIDWGNVDRVVQIGAPKGISRLLQRIGRANHRMNEPSRAVLVPCNRFQAVECRAAIRAIEKGRLDGEPVFPGALDVAVQFIMNCAVAEPIAPEEIYRQMRAAAPYRQMTEETFRQLLAFAKDGGYVLASYDRFARLTVQEDGRYAITDKAVAQRHRMNIGTIVEAGKLKVVLKSGRRLGGKVLGEVEEYFASLLEPGDSFLFAGQLLEFRGIRDMRLEVGLATRASEPKVPSYVGGNMPLSTYLAEEVRYLLADRSSWHWVGKDAEIWLEHQARVSLLPSPDEVLVETFPRQGRWYLAFYPFGGRSAHQSLGMLLTREMEHRGLKPMGFVASDYGVAVWSLEEVIHPETLLNEALLGEGYEEWLAESVLLKRSFGRVAVVSGLTERRMPGLEKTGRQVTFSTDLIYDVLRRHEPNHILLQINRLEAERTLVDTPRLSLLLNSMAGKLRHIRLPRISPLSIPLVLEIGREAVQGSAADALMQDLSREEQAELLLKEATEG